LNDWSDRTLLSLTPIPAAVNFIAKSAAHNPVTIGSFLDSNTTAMAGDFTAAITWGDGHTTAGTIEPTPTAGRFDVTGTNLYITPGTYNISIAINDFQGDSTTIASTAYVAATVLTPIGASANFTAGVLPSSPVTIGSFLDSNASATQGDFTAEITWGDGHTSAGTVLAVPAMPGQFAVSGTNLYGTPGSYSVSIAVQDNLGNMATIKSTAIATSPINATGTTFLTTPGIPLPAGTVVANFTDTNPAAIANPSTISAIVNWGDGQTSAAFVNWSARTDRRHLHRHRLAHLCDSQSDESLLIDRDHP